MTFLVMKQRLARRRNANASSLNTETAARYGDAINEVYRQILRQPGMSRLRDTTTTVDSVAGTQGYSVSTCARINRIWETTNDITLIYKPLAWLREVDPDPVQGTSTHWIPTDITKTTQEFLLWPTPAAAITYTLDITSSLTELSIDADVPLLPDDFHDLLVDGAELKELRKQDDPTRWRIVKDAFEQGMRDLRAWMAAHPDYTPGADAFPERSRLGSWFPAGT